jgi:RimJ/RimL family protein N-acetyltransferase
MFKIIDDETGEGVGSVGYWERTWHGEQVYETGWFVTPAFQGRGIAAAATGQAIALARAEGKHRFSTPFRRSRTSRRTRSAGRRASR